MKLRQFYSLLIPVLLLTAMAACSDRTPDDGASDSAGSSSDATGTDTNGKAGVASVPTETPTGRAQLPTTQTAAPDLWITLPRGYIVRADTTLEYDLVVVSRSDDPLLTDSTQVPYGMLRLVVGDSVMRVTPPEMKVVERAGMIGDYPGKWQVYTTVVPGQARYYSYELTASDYFSRISPESSMKKLHLHLYVAGRDTSVIRELLTAARSISTRP